MYPYGSAYDPEDDQKAIAALAAEQQPHTMPLPMGPGDAPPGPELSQDQFPDPTPQDLAASQPAPEQPPPPPPPPQPSPVPSQPQQSADESAIHALSQASAPKPASSDGDGPLGNMNGWALLADLVTNRGRGLGQIMSLANEQGNRKKAGAKDDALKQAQIDHLGRMDAPDSAKSMQAQERIDQGQARIDTVKAALEAKKAAGDQKSAQELEDRAGITKWMAEHAGVKEDELAGMSTPTMKALMTQFNTLNRHQMAPTLNADAADRAGGIAQSVIDVKHDANEQIAGDKAVVAGAEAGARLPAAQTLKSTPTPTEVRSAANQELNHSAIPGFKTIDEKAFNAATVNPGEREKIQQFAQSTLTSLGALDRMVEAQKKLGVGGKYALGDEDKQKTAAAMDADQQLAIGILTDLGKTKTLNAQEFPRYAGDLPNGKMSLGQGGSDALDTAISGLTGKSRDSSLMKLEATRAAIRAAVTNGMRTAGLDFEDTPTPAPAPGKPPAASPPPAAGGAYLGRPETRADPNNLGDLGNMRAGAPSVNSAVGIPKPTEGQNFPSGSGLHHVKKPDGTVIVSMLPPDQLQNLPKDWELVD